MAVPLDALRKGVILTVAASLAVYCLLFGTGALLYGEFDQLVFWVTGFALGSLVVFRWRGAFA